MNSKLNFVSIATILVLSILALLITSSATAQPIIVDGNGGDWDPSWFLAPDSASDIGITNGYDLTGVWQHYNATEDTLYFMYNVSGIAGDSDGKYGPNEPDTGHPGEDQYGVGSSEMYVLMINTSPTGDPLNSPDVMITFTNNSATVTGPKASLVSSASAAIKTTGTFTPFVEFSVGSVSGWMANPYKYSLYGFAGSLIDYAPEDWLDTFIYIMSPPIANFTFVAGACNQTVWFDPSGSYDDPYGGIVNYTWDFDDLTGEVRYDNSSFTHTFPDTRGTYDVNLTVTDTDGLTNSLVRTVIVNREPTISDVTANKTEVNSAGEWVRFTGTGSDPDDDSLAYVWSVTNASGTYTIETGTFATSYPSFSGAIDYFVSVTTTATLIVTDPYDCTDTDSAAVGVKVLCPLPHADADGPYRACVGDLVRFDGSGSSSEAGYHITEYCWDVDNDSVYEYCGSNPVYEYTYPGVYFGNAVLKVTNNCGSDTDTAPVIVEECAEEVPILTPAGILGLIGLLGIAGAGRIMRRK